MHRLLAAFSLLAPACDSGVDDTAVPTWVRATIGDTVYERDFAEALLLVDWWPNRVQVFSGEPLNVVVHGWEGDASQSWDLYPITGEGMPGIFWTDDTARQWWSVAGVFEIDHFENNPDFGPGDRRIGWADGTFEATMADIISGRDTLEITDGEYHAVLRHGEMG